MNINVHGNLRGGGNNGTWHVSNQGWGPWEVNLAYVLNFSQNDVSVLDLAPGSPTQYHVIQRLGFPSVTPR